MDATILGCTRVKNGIRYIDRWIADMLNICHALCILDDGSTDGTTERLQYWVKQHSNIFVHTQRNLPRDGGRDCRILHGMATSLKPRWIFAPDIDEFVDPEDIAGIKALTQADLDDDIIGWTFPFYYLWNNEKTYRADGEYERCHVIRLYRFDAEKKPPNRKAHAQMCPDELDRRRIRRAHVRIIHYGYMLSEDRNEKYEFYTKRDSDPLKAGAGVKNYAHIVEQYPMLALYRNRQVWTSDVRKFLDQVPAERRQEIIQAAL